MCIALLLTIVKKKTRPILISKQKKKKRGMVKKTMICRHMRETIILQAFKTRKKTEKKKQRLGNYYKILLMAIDVYKSYFCITVVYIYKVLLDWKRT